MKKIISIFLLIIYSSTLFAVTLDIHYCGGIYSGISLLGSDKEANCGCDHNRLHDKSCCTDKIICADTDNHKTVQQYRVSPNLSDFTLADYFTVVPVMYPHPASIPNFYLSSGFIRSHSPSFLTFICTYLN